MSVVAIIPARGGSKSVPGKNIKLLAGKPLIAYTIESALKSKYVDEVIVSTEDEEIAEISMSLGAQVPFMRPSEFSTDSAKSIDVVKHAILKMEELTNKTYPTILFLEPPAPFRTSEDIDMCIELFYENSCGSVVSVFHDNKYHPLLMKTINNQYLEPYDEKNHAVGAPRQLLKPDIYMINGCVYVIKRENVMAGDFYGEKIIPYIMSAESSINIDSMIDWYTAESILKRVIGKSK